MVRSPPRHGNRVAVESLQAGREHRAVDLVQEPSSDVHDTGRVDAEQVAVVREVVNRTERDPIDHGGDPLGTSVLDDVGRLDEGRLLQRTDRAALAVGAQDVDPEPPLGQPPRP